MVTLERSLSEIQVIVTCLSLTALEEVGKRWWQKEKDTEVFLTGAQEYVAIIEHY
jgi:hypothetical protein